MLDYLKLYVATLLVFLAIDLLWIGVIARGFYQHHLEAYLTDSPVWSAAFLFYGLFVAGLLVFVVVPGLREPAILPVLWRGALFGLVTYATYDLTNQATIKNWPLILTVVDLAWGTCLSTAVSLAGYGLGRWLEIAAEGS